MYAVVYSPDGGTHLASGGWDGKVCLWNSQTGELLKTFKGHTQNVSSVAFSPDGSMIACGNNDAIHIWDVKSGERLNTYRGHTDVVG